MTQTKLECRLLMLCLLLFVFLHPGFSQGKKSTDKRIAQLETEVKTLSEKVRTLEARISALEVLYAFPSTEKMRQSMIQSNEDAVISDLNSLAANAYQYFIRPTTMGGGGASFDHYTIPLRLSRNENGIYSISSSARGYVRFLAESSRKLGTITCTLDSTGRLGSFEYTGEFK